MFSTLGENIGPNEVKRLTSIIKLGVYRKILFSRGKYFGGIHQVDMFHKGELKRTWRKCFQIVSMQGKNITEQTPQMSKFFEFSPNKNKAIFKPAYISCLMKIFKAKHDNLLLQKLKKHLFLAYFWGHRFFRILTPQTHSVHFKTICFAQRCTASQ